MKTKTKERPLASIKLESKEIPIDEGFLKVMRKYVLTQMTLENLARELGLEGWEEAYELVKKTPAWLIWTPFTLWEVTE